MIVTGLTTRRAAALATAWRRELTAAVTLLLATPLALAWCGNAAGW
jgi:hypothetical protein